VKSLREQGVCAVGVRDPDVGPDSATGLFSLPGDQAPEALLLDSNNLTKAENHINGIKDAFETARVLGHDSKRAQWHKKVLSGLANELGEYENNIIDRLILAWLSDENEAAKKVTEEIRTCLEKD